jgi:hypothetical protein
MNKIFQVIQKKLDYYIQNIQEMNFAQCHSVLCWICTPHACDTLNFKFLREGKTIQIINT